MRVSRTILLALLSVVLAISLPIGRLVEVVYFSDEFGRINFMDIIDLSIYRWDVLRFRYPGIDSVFILWIFIALVQALNLLMYSRGMLSPIISWLVFLPALIAQIYLPSLVLNLAQPNPFLVSLVSEPNAVCSLPVALGLALISFGHWQKDHSKQWERIGYG